MKRRTLLCGFICAGLCAGTWGALSTPATIVVEEEIQAFREGTDSWHVQYGDTKGEWTKDGRFTVSVQKQRGFIMTYSRYPGMEPFPGAEEFILVAEPDRDIGDATAELVLLEFPGGEQRKFKAPFARETHFKTGLDPKKRYQIGVIGIHRKQGDGKSWKMAFSSLRCLFASTKAEALRVSAETGNDLYIVRGGCSERPVLRVGNASQNRVAAKGFIELEGFDGGTGIHLPLDVALEGKDQTDIPLPIGLSNGVWRIVGELVADDGSSAKIATRFAVMDYHGRTPKQPRGTFRMGVLWHIQRYSPADKLRAAAAMVACGAKLTRADVAHMTAIQGVGPDSWDFTSTDSYLEMLEENGIALDAIIFRTPRWAAKSENRTNSNWKVWAYGAPMPGSFGRFCEELAARYGTRIDYYEIGNEWDLNFQGTVDEAVAVQREAYEGLKRGCPEVCVIPNGWATYGDSGNVVKTGHAGFHEAFTSKAKDWFDVDAIHCHGPFVRYVRSIRDGYFPLRERAGVADKPWFSNETALTSLWSERNAAAAVWKKILWAWAHGSVDYIWYNLRGTGWNPTDSEQGYGLISADFRPRESFVAFAALAKVLGGGNFRRIVADEEMRYVFEFWKASDTVLTAWDESGAAALPMEVRTDAKRAWRIDLMGNRAALPLSQGGVSMLISDVPVALVLEGATFADVAKSKPALNDASFQVIPLDVPGRAPDFVLEKPEQVHDFFEADPSHVAHLWKGPQDNSAKVWLASEKSGMRILVTVRDDIHSQPFDGGAQFEGDDVQMALNWPGLNGQFEFGFAHRDDGRSAVHCWMAPSGFDLSEVSTWIELETSRDGDITRYDALIPFASEVGFSPERLTSGIRFDLMINDNDGDGRDTTLEITPGSFHAKDILRAQMIRFISQ